MCQDCQEDPNVEAKQNNEDIKTTTEQDLQNNNDVQDKSECTHNQAGISTLPLPPRTLQFHGRLFPRLGFELSPALFLDDCCKDLTTPLTKIQAELFDRIPSIESQFSYTEDFHFILATLVAVTSVPFNCH